MAGRSGAGASSPLLAVRAPACQVARGARGELVDGARAEDANHGAEGEVVLGRHNAGEGTEEPVGLLLVGGDGGEEEALGGPGRGEGGEADGEVIHAADGPVASALMVVQRAGQRPATAQPCNDGGGQVAGVA